MLYTEVVKQTQAVMGDSLTHMQAIRSRGWFLIAHALAHDDNCPALVIL